MMRVGYKKVIKMKSKTLLHILLLSLLSSTSFAAIDCNDPKNLPRLIGGMLIGGEKECLVSRGSIERAKRSLDGTIGKDPATDEVTSKAKLAEADQETINLKTAQMNYDNKKLELEEAEKAYAKDISVENSRRVKKAHQELKEAQLKLEVAEEIKSKADRIKADR